MRSAVVAVLALAALSGSAAAGSWSWTGKAKQPVARRAQATTCLEALSAANVCLEQWKVEGDNGASEREHCCVYVDQLSLCGSENLYAEVAGILGQTSSSSLLDVLAGMKLIGECPRTGNSDEDCTTAITTANACAQPPTSGGETCCPVIGDVLNECVGQATGTAGSNGGNNNGFWDTLESAMDATGCQAFPESMCVAAATAFSTCIGVVDGSTNGEFNDYNDCCHWYEWFSMFCDRKPSSVWDLYAPSESIRVELSTSCNRNGPSSNSGSFHNSNSGSYNGGYCDWSKVVGNGIFQWYQPQYGTGYVVTNNNMYATGGAVFYDYGNQPWYSVNYVQYPGFYKLQPFNLYCYGGGYYP